MPKWTLGGGYVLMRKLPNEVEKPLLFCGYINQLLQYATMVYGVQEKWTRLEDKNSQTVIFTNYSGATSYRIIPLKMLTVE